MKMSVGVLDHYNVSTRQLNETVQFYENVLGFISGPRPPFNFPGAWLYSAGHPVLHLNDISQTDGQQRPDSGVIDHVAFSSRGFEAMKRHLTDKGVLYHVNQVPNSARCRFSSAIPTTWRSSSISRARMRPARLRPLRKHLYGECRASSLVRRSDDALEREVIEEIQFKFLRSIDTPTVCNLIEIAAPERRGAGYTASHLHCPFPELPPMAGGFSLQQNDAAVSLCVYPGPSSPRCPVRACSLVSSLLLNGAKMSQKSSLPQSAHSSDEC